MPQIDVRINSMYLPGTQGGTRAYASATIDGCFAVRGIKLVEGGKDGLFDIVNITLHIFCTESLSHLLQ